ncbi:MAG: Stage V sporulation protein E [Parcubacteria group bacterium GW2011_GWD2_38_12]|uniref:Probable peptidoglycan glycosyltransferase FtsW n=1 Tax=Candidatus Azambacteria bacterium RIFCSPLOWO2_01_FULL_37_9 TaxID=1797297 RepID=A0A1F5C5N6_9BACT|nr:MAG: Stage V sporulation protein E [Parcubacteria group bacterium GW2011_GWC2_36_17]KKQ43627.1 MAG: Stage V sporulation protein E [Parcubacteria group bacterium GW2011_GWE2_37_8]KKQ51197.1 MAG: Stage V sporulation protein E [Parcubacteria group bacterium GW2011_GWD2_38_12]KKQ58512.1 MAG: Stage V sporulation protein E [Parcubacteria group bacterium GW2011_GWC1_38_17]KKQ59415.1 MAG: Stage V sporulation protein E [Parcubacteria group bacterium GW2011_GWD1_38_16]OGD38183.1 MAG: cell division pr
MNSYRWIEITTFILIVLGLAILASSGVVLSYKIYGNNYYYLKHQIFPGLLLGIAGFFIARKIPHQKLKKIALPLLVVTIALLVAIFFDPVGFSFGGARRWIQLGGYSFQPAEILKISFVIYLAAWMEKRQNTIRNISLGFLPFLVMSGIIAFLLYLQPDFGTLGVILITGLLMFFVAGSKITHIITTILLGIIFLIVSAKISPYRFNRFLTFLNPEQDLLGIGYQINQAIIAIGSGGLFGLGIGQSRQKYNYLPEPIGDSIFAIASEEMGFIGALIIISLFLIFGYFGYKISKNAPTEFGKLLGFGLTSWIVVQALINITAISGLIPLTGVPLPFISFGGTSLIMALISVGIISNIAKRY